ncbi:MAG: hypothetical protein MJA29_09970 [Candidatus Omnitrophica bacterium]|nr:hypothetical protein [Candidatus Omnitrophota bacterium]
MNILTVVTNPVVFFGVLALLVGVSLGVIVLWSRKDRKLVREKDELLQKINRSFSDVVTKADEREQGLKSSMSELEKKMGELQTENAQLQNKLSDTEKEAPGAGSEAMAAQLRNENVALNSKIAHLQEQLDKAIDRDSRETIEKLKQELELKEKLYEGLKGQYSELEKSSENLLHQLEEEKKSQRMISQKLWDITKPKEM